MFNNLFLIFGISEKVSKFLYAILAVIGVLLLIKILIKNEESRGWIFGLIVFVAFCSALVCGFKIYQYATVKGGTVGDFIHSLVSSSSAEKISDYTFKFNKVAFSPTGNENEYNVTIEEVYKQTDESGNEIIGSFNLDLTKNWNIYVNDSNTNNTVKGTNYINADYIYSFYNEDLQHILTDTLKIKFVFYKNYYRVDLITTGGELAVDFWESYIYKEGLTVGLKVNEYVQDTEIKYDSVKIFVGSNVKANGQNIEWKTDNSNAFLNIYYCNDYEGSYASHIEDIKHAHNFVLLNKIELVVNSVNDLADVIESCYEESLTLGKESAVYYFEIDNQNPYINLNESKIEMREYCEVWEINKNSGLAENHSYYKTVHEVTFIDSCYCNIINYDSINCCINMTFDYDKYKQDSNPSIHFDITRTSGLYETDTNSLTKSWNQLIEDGDIVLNNGLFQVENKQLEGDLICGDISAFSNSITSNLNFNSMYHSFADCSKLTSIDLSNFDTSNVKNMEGMFLNCLNLKTIAFGDNFKTNNVTNMSYMFCYCDSLTELNLADFKTNNVKDMSAMFYMDKKLVTLDLSSFNTSSVTNFFEMFFHCESLISLDLSNFDTWNAESMGSMFANCSSLTGTVGVDGTAIKFGNNFKTKNVTNMQNMFMKCKSLIGIDLSDFETNNVTDMGSMFSGCENVEYLYVNNFNSSKVTSMDSMFSNCAKLKSLDISNWVIGINVNVTGFFSGRSLENLKLCAISGYTEDNVIVFYMYGCSKLRAIEYAGNKKSWNSIKVAYPLTSYGTTDTLIVKCSDGNITVTLKDSV